jgi:hypothetical protein
MTVERYPCDLCRTQRPKKPRCWGVGVIDTYWACAFCIAVYRHRLLVEGTYAARS